MRGNSSILILILIVAVLCGLLLVMVQKPAVKKTAGEALSDEDVKLMEKAEVALDNASFAVAVDLLDSIKKSKDLKLRLLRAETQAGTGKIAETQLQDLEKEVVLDRGVEMLFHLARIHQLCNNEKKAQELYTALLATKISPALKNRISRHLFFAALEKDDLQGATRFFKNLCEGAIPPAEAVVTSLIKKLLKGKMKAEFDEIARLVEKQFPKSFDLLTLIARSQKDQGNLDESIRLYEILSKANAQNPTHQFALYQLYRLANRKEAAYTALEKICESRTSFMPPASQAVLLMQASMDARQSNNLKKAYSFLRKALITDLKSLGSGDEKAIQAILEYADAQGDEEERAFQTVFKPFLNGDFPGAEQGMSQVAGVLQSKEFQTDLQKLKEACRTMLAMDQSFQKAEEERRKALAAQKAPKKPPALPTPKPVNASQAAPLEQSEIAKVKEALLKASGNTDLQIQSAGQLFDLGDAVAARAALEPLLAASPDKPEANYQMARLLRSEGKAAEAAVYIEKAITIQGRESRYHSTFALLLIGQGNLEKAGNEAKVAFYGNPKNAEGHLAMALWFAHTGEKEETLKFVDSGLKAEEMNPLILKELNDLKAKLSQN